jgi:hypothetical protein
MKPTKLERSFQLLQLRKKLKRTKSLLKHYTAQLSKITDENLIKFKLRQCDNLNRQRISFLQQIERLKYE